jgi:hypothetical protein
MTFTIKHADRLSRGELLLRSFFGIFYIYLPHGFVLFFMGLWGSILSFISFWIILFTGRYPQSFFEFQVGLIRWQTRVRARMYNLTDGYPAFGIDSQDEAITVEVPYPESISRGMLIVKLLFGWIFVLLPHGFVLGLLSIGALFAHFIGWWVVLFTGRQAEGIHNFLTGYLRWGTRVGLYMANMTDTYPPFSLD